MKAIILAAGYATRLWPLTKNTPKPLLKVKEKPIVEHIIAKLDGTHEPNEIFIVTNNKFFKNFLVWKEEFKSKKTITIVNDRTMSNEDRLGSLGDIRYVVENMQVTEDILVIAGDNLFEFDLDSLFQTFKEKSAPVVALYDVKDSKLAKLYGIVSIDDKNKIINFEEKPQDPKSTLASTGIYLYTKDSISKLIEFTDNHDTDKAGDFLQWLYPKQAIFGVICDQSWFDIGSLEQLNHAKKEFNPI